LFAAVAKPGPPFGCGLLERLVGLLLFVALIGLSAGPCAAAGIVLDPGHGGNDPGAGQESEFNEKRFTLSLAEMVAAEINPEHRVELTRNADIELTPADRAGLANHLKADLLVSIHGAVAPYCSPRSAAIYYHDDERLVMNSVKTAHGSGPKSSGDRPIWERLQNRHRQNSRKIAEAIQKSLAASESFDSVAVRRAPLAILMGADLPAVLIEAGCFNPAVPLTREQFEQGLNAHAGPLARAIEAAVENLK